MSSTREQILDVAGRLIHLRGFHNTSVDDILRECGVGKGNLYYYFKSKEEFGLAIIDHFAERFEQRLDTFLNDNEVTPLNRIRNFLESAQTRVVQNQCSKGCLIGNLGQELADINERFRARLEDIFRIWWERFASCLKEAEAAGELSAGIDPEMVACFILSGWEGAILRAKVMKSPQPMRDFIEVLFASVLQKG